VQSVEPRALDVVRYAQCAVDLTDVSLNDEALDRVRSALARELERCDGRTLGVRVTLTGRTPLHSRLSSDDAFVEHSRALAVDLAGEELFVEKVSVRTSAPAAQAGLRRGEGPLAALLAALDVTRRDPAALGELAAELSDLRSKLPAELREGEDALRLEDPLFVASQLDAVEQLLVSRLIAEADEP
jgi:hypothetical protein